MKAKTRKKYQLTLDGYLRWRSDDVKLFRPMIQPDPSAPDACEVMFAWESLGHPLSHTCSEPDLLASYIQGKRSMDWHISEWKAGIQDGLFWPWEFIGTFGLTWQELKKLFGADAHSPMTLRPLNVSPLEKELTCPTTELS